MADRSRFLPDVSDPSSRAGPSSESTIGGSPGIEPPVDDGPSLAELVRRLRSAGLDRNERRRLILEAEVSPAEGREALELAVLLREFVEENLASDDPDDSVAVGSAIRKFIAVSDVEEALRFAADLLAPSPTTRGSIARELETAKMVVRKLVANPTAAVDGVDDLSNALWDMADTYLKPRLVAREKHGASALQAVLGLALLRAERAADAVDRVRSIRADWFEGLVRRELLRLEAAMRGGGREELRTFLADMV